MGINDADAVALLSVCASVVARRLRIDGSVSPVFNDHLKRGAMGHRVCSRSFVHKCTVPYGRQLCRGLPSQNFDMGL